MTILSNLSGDFAVPVERPSQLLTLSQVAYVGFIDNESGRLVFPRPDLLIAPNEPLEHLKPQPLPAGNPRGRFFEKPQMTTPDYRYHREPPRRLTSVRTEVNPTTTILSAIPDAPPLSIGFLRGIRKAILATAFFRSWHFIVIFTLEATIVTYLYQVHGYQQLAISNTLLAVLGTVLGFVISYRSSASFDRYNEGRRYWSQVVYSVRMFAKVTWYHIPDVPINGIQMAPARNLQEYKARMLVEKKTVLNLLEGFAVALKHYLRGEEGCYYEDLYPLVKFLPQYALPAGTDVRFPTRKGEKPRAPVMHSPKGENFLPLPVTSNGRTPTFTVLPPDEKSPSKSRRQTTDEDSNIVYLLPSRNPPPYHIFDMWPFYLCIRAIQRRGMELKGRKALRDRARNRVGADNVPLEITHYLNSYISSLQQRGVDGLSCGQMIGALSQLLDALTGLERILSTPVPWAYQVHLWTVTLVWLLALPFQVIESMGWLAIPGVALAAFVYCGLMKCAEELENPFGYDFNDLNLDHFTHNIIRKELQAMVALPMADASKWAFGPENDAAFDAEGNAIYIDTDVLGVTDLRPSRRSLETLPSSPLATNPKSPSSGSGMHYDGSGNAALGGPGGAGMIAGSAIAAGAVASIPSN